MNAAGEDRARRLRIGAYAILIALAAGDMAGRLLAVNSVNRMELEKHVVNQRLAQEQRRLRAAGADDDSIAAQLEALRPQVEAQLRRQRPFLSGNDRSRWLTVRALVEQGTFEIDALLDEHVWTTIDMVQHRGDDGELHLYSSKPPLLAVLLAGLYWAIRATTGWTLAENPYEVGRLILMVVNVAPMALLIALVARWAERLGGSDWGRVFVVAAAALGTMLTAFATVLNNHLIAAVSAAIAADAFMRIRLDGDQRLRWYALAGGFSAFAAADELPALSMLALMGAALFAHNARAWAIAFAPAATVVVVAFFATNYMAHNSLRPPYAHRHDSNPGDSDPEDNWYAYTYEVAGRQRPSYWLDPQGIDRGESSKATYAVHVLVGHHGVFSLTPVWVLSALGAIVWLRRGDAPLKQLAAGIAVLAIVCLAFYIGLRPQQDRNYGGMTSGFRWMFWQAPLWLLVMIPAADWTAKSRLGMALALVLLAFSVLSASYPTWNPWTQPWIYNWLEYNDWRPEF